MELNIVARFRARDGCQRELADAIRKSVEATREEPGCVFINGFRSNRDPQLFFILSRFVDEAAFEWHARLPRVIAYLERVATLTDHPLDVNRVTQYC